jgi:hypothetical protein
MLRRILQELAETAPLALLAGSAIGIALVGLLTGAVGESSNESLEVLVLGSLQVVTPLGVSLIWICRCAPLRLAVAVRRRVNRTPRPNQASESWRCHGAEVAGAACSAVLLVPWFEAGLLLGGLLTTPRAGLGFWSELQELPHLMPLSDLLRCFLRAAVFTAAAQWVCLRKAGQVKGSEGELARLLADALPQSLLVVMGLEVIWLTLLVPLHGTYA